MSDTFAVLLISPKGETIDKLLLHMTQPVDGQMDERASYVALSRATALDNLFMVEPITLDRCATNRNKTSLLHWGSSNASTRPR